MLSENASPSPFPLPRVTQDGGAPLHEAARNLQLKVIKVLLDSGANLVAKDNVGNGEGRSRHGRHDCEDDRGVVQQVGGPRACK